MPKLKTRFQLIDGRVIYPRPLFSNEIDYKRARGAFLETVPTIGNLRNRKSTQLAAMTL